MIIRGQKGFTGIDVTISVIIITIFITVIGNLITNINLNSKNMERKTIATSYAVAQIEKIKAEGINNYIDKGVDEPYIIEEDIIKDNVFTGYHKKVIIKDYKLISEDNTKKENLVKEVTVEIWYKLGNKDKNISISTYITKR